MVYDFNSGPSDVLTDYLDSNVWWHLDINAKKVMPLRQQFPYSARHEYRRG